MTVRQFIEENGNIAGECKSKGLTIVSITDDENGHKSRLICSEDIDGKIVSVLWRAKK